MADPGTATLAAPGDLEDGGEGGSSVEAAPVPVTPEQRPTLLIYQFTGNDVKEGVIRAATDFAASAFKKTDRFDLLTMTDVETLVELEATKQAAGCTDVGCMAEIAGAVGADYVATGEINAVGEIFAIKLSLLHPEDAKLVGIETLKVGNIENIPDLMGDAALRLAYMAFGERVPEKLKNRPREIVINKGTVEEVEEGNLFGSVLLYGGAVSFGMATLAMMTMAGMIGVSLYAVSSPTTNGWLKLFGRFAGPLSVYALVPVLAFGALATGCAGVGYVLE